MANKEKLISKIGRVTRLQYWLLMLLFMTPIFFILEFSEGWFGLIVAMILAIPIIHAYIGRWHDLWYTGWMALLSFIPIIGFLTSIYISLVKGEEKDNKYGPNPYVDKYAEMSET